MNNLGINWIRELPFVREAQKGIPRCKTLCAIGALAGITIAGLAAYRYINRSVPNLPSLMPSLAPETQDFEVNRPQATVLELAATSSSPLVSQFLSSIPEVCVMQRLLRDPFTFYNELSNASGPTSDAKFLRLLDYCNCPKLSADSRMRLQKYALDLIERTVSKESPITIVSVGPGGFYQELIYLAHLSSIGYKFVNLVLIEKEDRSYSVTGLEHFIEKYIPNCEVTISLTDDLETYVENAKNDDGLKPNLLLMLDLDDFGNNINEKNLADYSFELFNKNGLIKNGSVIAYSNMPQNSNLIKFPKTICCSYDGSKQLNAIQADRHEELVYPNGINFYLNSADKLAFRIC